MEVQFSGSTINSNTINCKLNFAEKGGMYYVELEPGGLAIQFVIKLE